MDNGELLMYDNDDGNWGTWNSGNGQIRIWSGHFNYQGSGSNWPGWRSNLLDTLLHEAGHDLLQGGSEGSAEDMATTCNIEP